MGCLVVSGFGMIFTLAGANTILQTIVSDDMRGRIMSCYAMAFMGMVPLGSLLAGTLARQLGAPRTIALGGVCCLLGAALFASRLHHLRALVRPIYLDKGIVSTPAPGQESAGK
jgi:MFS family permease